MSNIAKVLADTIHKYGELVKITPKGGDTVSVSACVQKEYQDPLVNDFDLAAYTVYVAPSDLAAPPVKFDRVEIRGRMAALDEDAIIEKVSDVEVAYIMRVK